MKEFISEYSTKWAMHQGQWLNPHELAAKRKVYGFYVHESDLCEINEVLKEERDRIKLKMKTSEAPVQLLDMYFKLENKVRQYLEDEIYRMRTGRDVLRRDMS